MAMLKMHEFYRMFISEYPRRGDLAVPVDEEMMYLYGDGVWEVLDEEDLMRQVFEWISGHPTVSKEANATPRFLSDVVETVKRMAPRRPPMRPASLAFRNGAFDFRDMTFKAHDRTNLAFVKLDFDLPMEPVPTPSFDAYMSSTFVDPSTYATDDAMVDFMIKALSYYVYPRNPVPFALVLYGPGANGKSVLVSLLECFFGPRYVSSASMDVLSSKHGMAAIVGKFLNVVTEDQSKRTDPAVLKALISQESVNLERKYRDAVSYRPTAKHLFSTNRELSFDSVDFGTMRRIFSVPFFREFEARGSPRIDGRGIVERDPLLIRWEDGRYRGKLVEEMPGIARKLIDACVGMEERGWVFPMPPRLEQAQRDVQMNSSSALEFLLERYAYDPAWPDPVAADALYQEYKDWYDAQERSKSYRLSARAFSHVVSRNFPGTRTDERPYVDGVRVRARIRLRRL